VSIATEESYRGNRDPSAVTIDRPMPTGGASCQTGLRLDAERAWGWLDIIADPEHIGNANKPSMVRGREPFERPEAKIKSREVRHE
jgi:hypothetical protein